MQKLHGAFSLQSTYLEPDGHTETRYGHKAQRAGKGEAGEDTGQPEQNAEHASGPGAIAALHLDAGRSILTEGFDHRASVNALVGVGRGSSQRTHWMMAPQTRKCLVQITQ